MKILLMISKMGSLVKIFSITLLLLVGAGSRLLAQCAMCRATVENSLSNGDTSVGAGLNFGILYLFAMPYLIIGIVGFLWYRKSKADAKKKQYNKRYSHG